MNEVQLPGVSKSSASNLEKKIQILILKIFQINISIWSKIDRFLRTNARKNLTMGCFGTGLNGIFLSVRKKI